MGLFDAFFKELAIRKKLRQLSECEELIALALERESEAYWLLRSQQRRKDELRAELVKLEGPDDIVRRGQQA